MTAQIIKGQTMEPSLKMSSRFQNLRDKVAVVTGASSGIGKSIARALAEEGAQVCLVGNKLNTLGEVEKLVREHALEAEFFAVTSPVMKVLPPPPRTFRATAASWRF